MADEQFSELLLALGQLDDVAWAEALRDCEAEVRTSDRPSPREAEAWGAKGAAPSSRHMVMVASFRRMQNPSFGGSNVSLCFGYRGRAVRATLNCDTRRNPA